MAGLQQVFMLRVEGHLALDESRGLLFDLGLSDGGPLAHAVLELRQLAMLLGNPVAKLEQLFSPRCELFFFEAILVSQFKPQLGNGLCRLCRAEGAIDLRPQLVRQ